MVGTISLLCETLRPMLLTVCGVPLKDNELRLLGETFATVRTVKGYMTIAAMKTYVTTCLAPDCHGLREKFQENLPVFLIMDNHSTHNHPDVLEMLSELNVHAIWLPPHSSHFLQPLDLSVFASLKHHYCNLRTRPTKPKIEGKLLRALHAWHLATWPGCISSAWSSAGIAISGPLNRDAQVMVGIGTLSEIMDAHCVDPRDLHGEIGDRSHDEFIPEL
jgi:hypothetical protein